MRRAARLTAGVLVAAGVVGCSGTSWHVPKGQSERFREARAVCRKLTDDDGRKLHEERFADCMKRRGFRHERFYDRMGIKIL